MTCSKPGPELDAEVATRVMGWEREALPPASDYGPTTRAYWVDRKTKRRMLSEMGTSGRTWDNRAFRRNSRVWSPSTSIADAWEVVEKLAKEHVRVEVASVLPGTLFRCRVWKGQNPLSTLKFPDIVESTPTAPLAICLAALNAVSENPK